MDSGRSFEGLQIVRSKRYLTSIRRRYKRIVIKVIIINVLLTFPFGPIKTVEKIIFIEHNKISENRVCSNLTYHLHHIIFNFF